VVLAIEPLRVSSPLRRFMAYPPYADGFFFARTRKPPQIIVEQQSTAHLFGRQNGAVLIERGPGHEHEPGVGTSQRSACGRPQGRWIRSPRRPQACCQGDCSSTRTETPGHSTGPPDLRPKSHTTGKRRWSHRDS
jgi:hypothetical protein